MAPMDIRSEMKVISVKQRLAALVDQSTTTAPEQQECAGLHGNSGQAARDRRGEPIDAD